MGLCRCPRRKVTTQFCYEHRKNVCESCMVNEHPNCIVQGYLQWLKDSDYEPICALCRVELDREECIRLLCFHVFHWRCLDGKLSQLPATTAPAGYTCPTCGYEVIPRENVVSPVADVIRQKLRHAKWAIFSGAQDAQSINPDHRLESSSNLASNWSTTTASFNSISQKPYNETPQHGSINRSSGGINISSSGIYLGSASLGTVSSRATQPLQQVEDDDKYKRKSVYEFLHRWWQSRILKGGARRRDPTKSWLTLIVITLAVMVIVIYAMSQLGRYSTESDPMLNIESNPNIHNEPES